MGCCGWGRDTREPDALAAPLPGASLVEQRRMSAAVELNTATGGASLCRLEGSPGVKRAEGALAALSEVHRLLGRSTRFDPAEGAATVLTQWRDHRVAAERLGPAWVAYRDGGIAALESLQEDLR